MVEADKGSPVLVLRWAIKCALKPRACSNMKLGEVAPAVIFVEALQRLGHLINRALVTAFHVAEKLKIIVLGFLVFRVAFRGHGFSFLKSTFPTGEGLSTRRCRGGWCVTLKSPQTEASVA